MGSIAIDAKTSDALLANPLRDRRGTAGEFCQMIRCRIVADGQHQLEQVQHGNADARMLEGLRKTLGIDDHRMFDGDQVIERDRATIDFRQDRARDRDLERAGHRK